MIWLVITFILKAVALVLLCLTAVCVSVLLLLLFVPVRYRAMATADKKIVADVRATWFLRIVQFFYVEEGGEARMTLRCLGFHLIGGPEKPKRTSKKRETHIPEPSMGQLSDDLLPAAYEPGDPEAEGPLPDTEAGQPDDSAEQGTAEKQKFMDKMNNIVEKVNHYIEQIGSILHYPDKALIVELVARCLKRLWRGLRPDTLAVEGELGFADPSVTGVTIGGLYAIAGIMGIIGWVHIKGNFKEKAMFFDVKAKGTFTLWAILWPLVLLAVSRPIWKIIQGYNSRRKRKKRQAKEGRYMYE